MRNMKAPLPAQTVSLAISGLSFIKCYCLSALVQYHEDHLAQRTALESDHKKSNRTVLKRVLVPYANGPSIGLELHCGPASLIPWHGINTIMHNIFNGFRTAGAAGPAGGGGAGARGPGRAAGGL